jgi:hypothetical protein
MAVAIAVLLFLVAFYLWVYRRNRALGTPGIVSRSRLTCPKCHQTFDFDYIPGESFTAVRLGTSRYVACPPCHRWSVFELMGSQIPVGPPQAHGGSLGRPSA